MSVVPTNTNPLEQIKLNLDACVGKKIRLKANKGRKKVVEAEGILENTYPNIFVIRLDKSSAVKRLSYTYADVLTQTVELTVDDHRIGAVSCGTAEGM
ncbi:MAG TPA: Veg family protein [Limnochordia bacterium]|nr:Veg family protein [Bacillota bacterium]HKM17378.1 Veg family protein [Limnochordia bacterium]